jgi:hypothetical protein
MLQVRQHGMSDLKNPPQIFGVIPLESLSKNSLRCSSRINVSALNRKASPPLEITKPGPKSRLQEEGIRLQLMIGSKFQETVDKKHREHSQIHVVPAAHSSSPISSSSISQWTSTTCLESRIT